MSVDILIMLMGAVVATLPFLGFPIRMDNLILVAIGIIVISLGIIVRRREVAKRARERRVHQAYIENTPQVQAEHETA
jgi:uncharacterized membrane protein YccF (DUF307 family)